MGANAIPRTSPAKLLERQVTRQVSDFLAYRGWRKIRMQSALMMGGAGSVMRVGEPGIPDVLFLRYLERPVGACLALWVEFKAPTGTVRPHQAEWHRKERLREAMVWVVDDLEEFIEMYECAFGWLHRGDRARGQ